MIYFNLELARYWYRLSEQYEYLRSMKCNLEVQLPKLTPNDRLNFFIDVLSHSVDSNSITHLKTLLHNYEEVSCKRFCHEGSVYLVPPRLSVWITWATSTEAHTQSSWIVRFWWEIIRFWYCQWSWTFRYLPIHFASYTCRGDIN